jgi:hypothetical protein
MKLLLGISVGFLLGLGGTAALVEERIQSLTSVNFLITSPPVPRQVLEAVQIAEQNYYARQSAMRRMIEGTQDVAAFLSPSFVYKLDFSVGPFRLKGHTLNETIPWAMEHGYLEIGERPIEDFHWLYVYLAEQPGLADWGAAVLLERLRVRHPQLSQISWQEIATDPILVAKIYSGYVGAGGDWDLWESDLRPGPVAAARMGVTLAASPTNQ